jgi:DNA-directed RNA polymerase specialized sigma subunit
MTTLSLPQPIDSLPEAPKRKRRQRTGAPLEQPLKPGSPPRTELSERLITENQGLAEAAAAKWSRRCSRPFEDFIGPALEGLINGCRRYDPKRINPSTGRPYAISSCVCAFIEGAIKHHIRDHGYDVKMPAKWREYYPKARRLLAEGQTLAQVATALPMFEQDEIVEMMGGMVGTMELEDELTLFSQHQPQATEAALAPALYGLSEAAFTNLRPADRGLLERWAADPFKRPYPSGPMLQFHNRLKAQLRGRTLEQFRQGLLGLDVASVAPVPRERRPRRPKPAPVEVVQPSLFPRRKPHPKAVKL